MRKGSLNAKGFGITGALVVIVALVVVGGAGVLVYHRDHKAKAPVNDNASKSTHTSSNNNTTTNSDPYAGWTTANLKYEQVTFKYPVSWKINSTSKDETQTGGVSNPGADSVTLTSPTGQMVSIETGLPYTFETGTATVLSGAQSLKSLGDTYYLDFYNRTNSATDAIAACLDKSSTTTGNQAPYITSKNITLAPSSPAADLICIQYASDGQGNMAAKPASTFEQDPSFDDAKLIIESLAY